MLGLGISLRTPPAYAQTQDAALATGLFTDGRNLMKSGDYAGARKKLMESARLDPRVGTFANLGECEEKLGHPAAAWANWLEALNLARSHQDERLGIVEQEFQRIDRTVPKLLLKVPTPTPSGLVLSVDDVNFGADAAGTPVPVDPGAHTIVAKAPGKKAWTQQVQMASDGTTTAVSIPALDDEATESPGAPVEPSREAPPGETTGHASSLPTVSLVMLGASAVSAGVGTYFGFRAMGDKKAAQDACGKTYPTCPGGSIEDAVKGHLSAGQTDAAISTGAFVVSGAALATAAVLFFWPRPAGRPAGALRVAPAVGLAGGGLVVQGSW
jgi:hypothetical protein